MITLYLITQIMINICSFTSIYLATKDNPNLKYSAAFGLTGQPCWWYVIYHANQWALLPINILFTGLWLKNFYKHWLKRNKKCS